MTNWKHKSVFKWPKKPLGGKICVPNGNSGVSEDLSRERERERRSSDRKRRKDILFPKVILHFSFFPPTIHTCVLFPTTHLHRKTTLQTWSIQQGKMYLFVGLIMAIVQGGLVRRIKSKSELLVCVLVWFCFATHPPFLHEVSSFFRFFLSTLFSYAWDPSVVQTAKHLSIQTLEILAFWVLLKLITKFWEKIRSNRMHVSQNFIIDLSS